MRIGLYMDQAVVADLTQHSLYSQQFSSCAPIVLFNTATNKGGLYHFAGGSIEAYQQRDLRLMLGLIAPTDVYIFRGLGTFNMMTMGNDVMTTHIAGVTAVFNGLANIHQGHNGLLNVGTIHVSAAMGAINITNQSQGAVQLDLKTLAAIQNLPGGVTFIGDHDDTSLSKWA